LAYVLRKPSKWLTCNNKSFIVNQNNKPKARSYICDVTQVSFLQVTKNSETIVCQHHKHWKQKDLHVFGTTLSNHAMCNFSKCHEPPTWSIMLS
jgi:hypothetical protein